ncbi:MAG: tetratricopeptide repeat protein [Candidatus Korobacteraceae bacterium]|jgi:tetratricopeptide (TPR) repeat protein
MSYRVRYPLRLFSVGIWLAVALSILCLLISANLFAQQSGPATKSSDPDQILKGHQGAAIRITVVSADGKPLDRQALVKLHSVAHDTTNWQTTGDSSDTLFQDLQLGMYDIEASAVGYLSSRNRVDLADVVSTLQLRMTLERDPSVNLDDSDASISPKALQEMNRAIRALNAGDLKDAQKRLEEAEQVSPSSARLNFLLGYTYFEKGDLAQAQRSLERATTLNPQHGRAWTLLGRVHLLRGQYEQATTALQQAVVANPDNWISHDLLADAYLAQHDYEKARQQAELALEKASQDGTVAQLARGEALANLGKAPEAVQALQAFLDAHGKSAAAPHAQALLTKLEQGKSKATESLSAAIREAASFVAATDLLPAANSDLPASSWLPPGIDRDRPPVVAGLSCPYEKVIDEAGNRVEELVSNVEKFASIESILYQRLDPLGNPISSETRQFDYAAAMYEKPDVVMVDEYRTQRYELNALPDRIVDNGFAALALVFHPAMHDAFHMTCEGLGEWHGKATWLVRFQQRDDRPNHMQAYLLGSVRYPVDLKGRAWITADNFQIVRIESEMVSAMPQIQLLAEHVITEYGPVPFPKKNLVFWLPTSAEVYMDFRGHRYYRKHCFEKYMLFSVDTEEKVHEAKHDPTRPASTNAEEDGSSTS